MEDSMIIALYFARDEQAITETDKKYGGYCRTVARNILNSHEDSEEVVNDTYLKINDPYQREKYIRSLVEQVKNASAELDKLSYEYNVVTAVLKDMDELEALPPEEKHRVMEYAKKILYYQKEQQDYQKR